MAIENSGHDIYKSGYSRTFGLDLEWPAASGVSPRDFELPAARDAVAAFAAVCEGWVVPLELGVVQCGFADLEGLWMEERSLDRYWYLTVLGRKPTPFYTDPIVIEAPTIDRQAMTRLIEDAFARPFELPEGRWPGWCEIHAHATLARLPEALVPATGAVFVVDDNDNRIRDLPIPLQRRDDGVWVRRYDLGFWAPVTITVHREWPACGFSDAESHSTTLELSITVHWSVWWEPDSPGRALFDAGVRRLRGLGWYDINP